MEPVLRESFKIKHPEFEVLHEENTIIKHPVYPFLFASLDGILVNKETGEKGKEGRAAALDHPGVFHLRCALRHADAGIRGRAGRRGAAGSLRGAGVLYRAGYRV